MTSSIRVAAVAELPPGKGKVVEYAGQSFTVYNRDGRFFATHTRAVRRAPPAADTSGTCRQRGLEFEVWMEDSPARLADEEPAQVRVEDDVIWLVVD